MPIPVAMVERMETNKLAVVTAQPLVHPLDVIPHYVVSSSQPLGGPGPPSRHDQPPPEEICLPPPSTDTVLFALNSGPRPIQKRHGGHPEGPWYKWGIQIARAKEPRYWRTEGKVDNVHLDLE